MAKNVEFFDWKLNPANPVTSTIATYGRLWGNRRPDMHSAIHLGIVMQGENCGIFGKDELILPAGSLYLTAPWEPHYTGKSSGAQLLLITLDARSLEEFFCACPENLAALLQMSPASRMEYINRKIIPENCLEKIIAHAQEQSTPLQKLRLWHAVLEFFMEVIPERSDNIPRNNDYNRLLPVLEKLGSKMMPLEEAARICNLSTSRFSALFKNFSGLSFGRYERNFRLNGAAGDIRRGATFKEAAERWDFCDKSHLARLLKNF